MFHVKQLFVTSFSHERLASNNAVPFSYARSHSGNWFLLKKYSFIRQNLFFVPFKQFPSIVFSHNLHAPRQALRFNAFSVQLHTGIIFTRFAEKRNRFTVHFTPAHRCFSHVLFKKAYLLVLAVFCVTNGSTDIICTGKSPKNAIRPGRLCAFGILKINFSITRDLAFAR